MIKQEGQELVFSNLTHPRVVSEFIDILNETINSYNKNLILNFKNVNGAFHSRDLRVQARSSGGQL